jgi:hypothetical protein
LEAAVRIEAAGRPEGCKLIRVSAETAGDTIVCIRIRGDFFASPEERFDAVEEALAGTPVPALAESFDSLAALNGMETSGISGAGVAEVFNDALKSGAGEAGIGG